MEAYSVVEVFSATKARDREVLGEKVTGYLLAEAARLEVVGKVVSQSSDRAFHCLSIVLFLRRRR